MTGTYTLRILRLQCMQSQELDGDEPYLLMGDQVLWTVPEGTHMHHHPGNDNQFSIVDFAAGRVMEVNGWQEHQDFVRGHFVFAGLSGQHTITLMEADRLTSDDVLGRTPISERDMGRGEIQVEFAGDGARYLLVYRVDPA
ncbi:MAG: hypothetical protein KME04_19545 [Pleurocapsa minor GSE-CHR-MK-17-07R]|nr:hypothetical protein [Pleurocapsa minor GSE-CHR-MK 17-07R]